MGRDMDSSLSKIPRIEHSYPAFRREKDTFETDFENNVFILEMYELMNITAYKLICQCYIPHLNSMCRDMEFLQTATNTCTRLILKVTLTEK